jgi:hypothetical protein
MGTRKISGYPPDNKGMSTLPPPDGGAKRVVVGSDYNLTVIGAGM